MFLSREKFCYVFYDEKLGYVKERTKNVNAAMTANRIVVLLVFVSGIAVAVIGTLLSQYIRGLSGMLVTRGIFTIPVTIKLIFRGPSNLYRDNCDDCISPFRS